jgi:hypothetical protein
MAKSNGGVDLIANSIGNTLGFSGTATATTATTLTSSGFTGSNAYAGQIVTAGSVYGVILSNTTTVLTVDRWYAPATPGGSAGTTPGNVAFTVVPGQAPVGYLALSANASAAVASNTTLPGEITTAGLIRKIATYAHTAGTTTYTEAATWTAQAADVPVTVAKMGGFASVVSVTGALIYETLLSATATLSAVSDQITVTQTVTIS